MDYSKLSSLLLLTLFISSFPVNLVNAATTGGTSVPACASCGGQQKPPHPKDRHPKPSLPKNPSHPKQPVHPSPCPPVTPVRPTPSPVTPPPVTPAPVTPAPVTPAPVTPIAPVAPVAPAPPTAKSCPADSLKLGACVDLLGGLVHIGLGDPVVNQCCPLLEGLVELEAAVCLCTTIKIKLLNINIYLPLALQLLLTCGKTPPPGYTCTV